MTEMISTETLNSQHNSVIGEKSLDSLCNHKPNVPMAYSCAWSSRPTEN